jgi:hypothetical protein
VADLREVEPHRRERGSLARPEGRNRGLTDEHDLACLCIGTAETNEYQLLFRTENDTHGRRLGRAEKLITQLGYLAEQFVDSTERKCFEVLDGSFVVSLPALELERAEFTVRRHGIHAMPDDVSTGFVTLVS